MKLTSISLVAAVSASVALIACGGKDRKKESQESKEITGSPESGSELVGEVPLSEEGLQTDMNSEDEISSESGKASSGSNCATGHCFTLENWHHDFGQIQVASQGASGLEFAYLNGFINPVTDGRTDVQNSCLLELSETLQNYAKENPKVLDAFANAGLSTRVIARVYDRSAAGQAITPALFFVNRESMTHNASYWVIAASLTDSTCSLPSAEDIAEDIQVMKGLHIAEDKTGDGETLVTE